jgi:hypothetical protein
MLSAGRVNSEALMLGLGGMDRFVKEIAEPRALELPLWWALGGDPVVGGDAERASTGLIARIEAEE